MKQYMSLRQGLEGQNSFKTGSELKKSQIPYWFRSCLSVAVSFNSSCLCSCHTLRDSTCVQVFTTAWSQDLYLQNIALHHSLPGKLVDSLNRPPSSTVKFHQWSNNDRGQLYCLSWEQGLWSGLSQLFCCEGFFDKLPLKWTYNCPQRTGNCRQWLEKNSFTIASGIEYVYYSMMQHMLATFLFLLLPVLWSRY